MVKPAQQPQMLENFRSGRLSVELPSYARVKRYAFKGDGIGNCINIPAAAPLTNALAVFTVEALFATKVSGALNVIFIRRVDGAWLTGTFNLAVRPQLSLSAWDLNPQGHLGTINVVDGRLHHVFYVYDGATAFFDLEGKIDNPIARTGIVAAGAYASAIGSIPPPTSLYFFNGNIPLVRLYNVALTALERSHNRRYPFDAITRGLILEYLLEEGSGVTAYDTSGFGNNGTFNGANYWDTLGDDVLTFERV